MAIKTILIKEHWGRSTPADRAWENQNLKGFVAQLFKPYFFLLKKSANAADEKRDN